MDTAVKVYGDRFIRILGVWLILFVSSVCTAVVFSANSGNRTISGTITDPSGAAIAAPPWKCATRHRNRANGSDR